MLEFNELKAVTFSFIIFALLLICSTFYGFRPPREFLSGYYVSKGHQHNSPSVHSESTVCNSCKLPHSGLLLCLSCYEETAFKEEPLITVVPGITVMGWFFSSSSSLQGNDCLQQFTGYESSNRC